MPKKFVQPRLDDDVARMVATVATRNGRSIPKEVNFVLREYYTGREYPLHAIGPNCDGGPQPYSTKLDPRPRDANTGRLIKLATNTGILR